MEIGGSNATPANKTSNGSEGSGKDGGVLQGSTVSSSKVQQEESSALSHIQLNDPNQPLEALLKKESFLHNLMKSVTFKPGLLLVCAVTLSHFFGYMNLSYFWSILLVPLILASLKLILDRMVRQRVRKYQTMMREMKSHDYESLEWFNGAFRTVWDTYAPIVEKLIMTKLNKKLSDKKVEIQSISFGNRVPRLHRVKTSHPYPNSIEMETDIEIDSNLKLCVVYKKGVELGVKASNLFVSVSQLRILVLLSPESPFVPYLSITAIDKPDIDIKIKTQHIGIQLSEVPGLSNIIQNTIKEVVLNALYHPNKIEVDILSITTSGAKSGLQLKEELEGNLTKTVRRESAKKAAPDTDIFSVVESASDKVSKAVLNFGGAFKNKLFMGQSQPDEADEEEKRAKHQEKLRLKKEKKEGKQSIVLPNPLDVPNRFSESITGAIHNPFKKREKIEKEPSPEKPLTELSSSPSETSMLDTGIKSDTQSGSKIEEVKPAVSEPADLSAVDSVAPPKVPERASASASASTSTTSAPEKKLEHQDSKKKEKLKDKLAKLFHSEKPDSNHR